MADALTLPTRDRANGAVAGVAAGIARRLGVDPTLVRLLFALLALAGGAGIVLYVAAALLMPDEVKGSPGRGRTALGLALLLVTTLAALAGLGLPAFVLAAAVLAEGGAFLLWRRQQRVFGGALVALGLVVLLTGGDLGGTGPLLAPAAIAGGLLL